MLLRRDVHGDDGHPRPGGKHGRSRLGVHVLPLLHAGPLGEDEQLVPLFQAAQSRLGRVHVRMAPVHSEDARLAQQPADHGHPHQLDLGHHPQRVLFLKGESHKKRVAEGGMVGADHRRPLWDVLPPHGAYRMEQIEKGPDDEIEESVELFCTH